MSGGFLVIELDDRDCVHLSVRGVHRQEECVQAEWVGGIPRQV